MPEPQRGEVWLIDLGLVGKRRPGLVISVPPDDADRALVTFIPCTTARRNSRFEVQIPIAFLDRNSVFNAQGIDTISLSKLERRLGELTQEQLLEVENAVKRWLGLAPLENDSDTKPGGGQQRQINLD